MALVTVGHPIPGLTAYERFDDFSLAFVGGISGRINLSTGQQSQLTGLGYVINPATPAYESPYVTDAELADPDSSASVILRAASVAAVGDLQNVTFVASYLAPGATAAANTAAIRQAISDAAGAQKSVCFDGVDCLINDEIDLTTAGLRLWSSSPAACRIKQTTTITSGNGVFRVHADDVTIDGFTLTSDVLDNGTQVVLTGWTGDVHAISAIKVEPGVSGLTVKRIKGDHWFVLLAGFPYEFDGTGINDPSTYRFIKKLTVEDVEVDYVWAAVRMSGLEDASYRNVRGRYMFSTGHASSGAPPHLFYVSNPTNTGPNDPRTYSKNIRIADCHAQGGRGGSAFSLRYTNGMTVSNVTADDCDGLVDMIGVHGFTVDGWHASADVYPKVNIPNGDRGSFSLLFCTDGVVGPGLIESAPDFDRGRIFYIGSCDNVKMIQPRGWIDLVTPQVGGEPGGAYVSGHNVVVEQPELDSRGAAGIVGILFANGVADSTAKVVDPLIAGSWTSAVRVTTTTTRQTLIYDPDKLTAGTQRIEIDTSVTQAGAPILINTRFGYPPEQDARVLGWHFGERIATSAVLRTRWPSGQVSTVVTDAWVSAAPFIVSNATVTGLLCANFSTPDVDIECQVKYATGAGFVGLSTRVIDTSNYLVLVLDSTSISLRKRVAGTFTVLASAALTPATAGIWRGLRLRVVGNEVRGYLDGERVITHTLAGGDETTFATATSHGLASNNGGANSSWYGLRVRAA